MASLRGGYGLPARPSDGLRPRRSDDAGTPSSVPRPLNRTARKDSDVPRTVPSAASQSRLPSRVPQPASARRPSIPQAAPRPSLDHQSQSWGSASTTASASASASARTGTHAQSGSSSSSSGRSYDSNLKPARNVLRRKKSSIARDVAVGRDESPRTSSSSSIPRSQGSLDPALGIQFDRSMTDSPAEIYVAQAVELQKPQEQAPIIYPELDRYRNYQRPADYVDGPAAEVPYRLATQDLPPPTPVSLILSGNSSQVSALSGSPSTKFSESPGPGAYSRDTTPTSMSSQSPGLVAPRNVNPSRNRQHSPALTRPPVTRRRAGTATDEVDSISADPHGLASVRESLTSSSSNSTVRDGDKNMKHKKAARRLPPPPPSPPPRKSSQKFRNNRDEGASPTKPKKGAIPQPTTSPSPSKTTPSPRPQQSSPLKPSAPTRPSRNGTPDMHSQLFGAIPVIQSNLSSSSLPGERRGSEPTLPTDEPSARPFKNSSTSSLPDGPEATVSSRKGKKATESDRKLSIPEPSRPATRTPSPNVGSSSRRFPFFGRKKTAPDNAPDDKADKKSSRKGPAAGTGHEGYGRIGAVRRRSGGSSTNAPRGLSEPQSSQESLTNSDPFLADRVNPVVISGGEIVENRNPSSDLARTESNQSLSYGRPSTDSKVSSGASSAQAESRSTLWPSAIPRGAARSTGSRRPSDSSDSDGVAMKPTLAFRRSMQRLGSTPDNPLRLPHPINTSGVASSPMTSFDTSVMSDESHNELQQEVSRGQANPAHPALKKLTKRARSPRKWNPFSRSQSRAAQKDQDEKISATVTAVEKKPPAFYAMMDSSDQEGGDIVDIKEVLRSADVYTNSPKMGTSEMTKGEFRTQELPPQTTGTPPQAVNPDRPYLAAVEPSATDAAGPQLQGSTAGSGRPSRLAQVGRIPKVVSNRPEPSSPRSFSRPFRASLQLPPQAPEAVDLASVAKGPSPPETLNQVPDLSMESSTSGSGTIFTPSGGSLPKVSPEMNRAEKEFLAFSPRKNSDGTVGTDSSSSGNYSFAAATAIIPQPHDPLAEDEVWDEYNDLLGEDSVKVPVSATSSKGTPFHLETYEGKLTKEEKPMESPTLAMDSRKVSTHSMAPTRSSCYSADMTERIRTAFQPHLSPPMPVSGFDAASSRRERGAGTGNRNANQLRCSSSPPRSARQSGSSSGSSDDGSPLAQVNLRVGSMTVSKWLTFGHVLFSDVRHELVPVEGSLKRHSILVIDGLGNDDWSFYAAETYPAATFFNLSPRAPLPAELQTSPTGFPLSPPNHHQIQYVSHMEKFPFAPQSFTSVVYRFPVAASESSYRNILAEARRVLKPGGYLELSILDADLNNMGTHGRRTVRQLKESIHLGTPDINLASTADLMVRMLGRAGFSGIKAARVGVPVASPIARSDDGAPDKLMGERKKKKKKDQPSLAEMMRDESGMADEGITKMVSRVGRWWYTRCYEGATNSSSEKSIWDDKALLRECEELGTSLKLMVCCARAPDRVTSY